jgi:hypothetical protein
MLISLILLGCGGSSGGNTPKQTENTPPVLAFESTYSSNEESVIELSVDATDDKSIASYNWQQVSGKLAELSNTNESKLNFITPKVLMSEGEQTLEFEVVVTDNEGATSKASFEVNVSPVNTAPALTFVPRYTVNEQLAIELAVNATDDNAISSYAWQQVTGKPVTLSNTNESKLNFITPIVLMSEGEQALEFEVVVTDNEGASSKGMIEVSVTPWNNAPTVTISAVSSAISEESITLLAQAIDDDGEIESYFWQQTSGPEVIIARPYQATGLVTLPSVSENKAVQLKLVVKDNEGALTEEQVEVSVFPKLVVQTQESIQAKSGAFTKVEWEVAGGIEPYEIRLISSAEQQLNINITESNTAHFNAPIQIEDKNIKLNLTVTDANQQSVTKEINLLVFKAIQNFSNPKLIHYQSTGGRHIHDFDVADMDNDGLSDIIALQDNGTYWYKNKGNDNIDLTPRQVSSITPRSNPIDRPYYLKQDLTQDGFLDFVTIQYISGVSNLYLLENNAKGEFLTKKLIGEMSSGAIENAEVFTFESDGTTYIAAQSVNSNERRIVIFKQTGSDFIKVNSFKVTNEFDRSRGDMIELFSCNLTDSDSSDIYYEFTNQGDNLGEGQLYVLSASDEYQTPKLVKEYDLNASFFGCLKAQGKPDRLIQYIEDQYYTEGTKRTIEISFDNTLKQYSFNEFDSIFTNMVILSSSNFKALDINGDNIDDLILQGEGSCSGNGPCINSDSIYQIYIRNNEIELNFERGDFFGDYRNSNLTFWKESNTYYLFKKNKNDFLLSALVNNQNILKVEFPKFEKIKTVQYFDNHFIVEAKDSYDIVNSYYFTFKGGVLVEDQGFNLDLFQGNTYIETDLNNDGILDALYGYRRDSNGVVARRLGTDEGLDTEDVLTYTESWTKTLERAIDVNNDGFLDFSVLNSWADEQWMLYQETTDTYIPGDGFYLSDMYNNTEFTDLNNDGLLDIINLGEYTSGCRYFQRGCGYLEVRFGQSAKQFSPPIRVDERHFGIQDIVGVDVDQDGFTDLMVKAWLPDEMLYHFNWYKTYADGTFELNTYHPPGKADSAGGYLGEYIDINGTGKAYFTAFSNYRNAEGDYRHMIKYYQYNSVLKRPVIEQVQLMPKLLDNRMLIDLDMDKDLDVIQHDDHNIYLIENLH